jgi:hypothetical protein
VVVQVEERVWLQVMGCSGKFLLEQRRVEASMQAASANSSCLKWTWWWMLLLCSTAHTQIVTHTIESRVASRTSLFGGGLRDGCALQQGPCSGGWACWASCTASACMLALHVTHGVAEWLQLN